MSTKKNLRSDNTYIISTEKTDNPKLGAKVLSNGQESLFLDYYLGYKRVYNDNQDKETTKIQRKREFLKLYLNPSARTPQEREDNKSTLELAKKIRYERSQSLLESDKGYRIPKDTNINFLDFWSDYIEKYTKADVRMLKASLARFKEFLKDTPEYSIYLPTLKIKSIDKDMVMAYTEYLNHRGNGEGPLSYYKRFKKVINYAIDHEVITKNPCKGVTITNDSTQLRKDVLSADEYSKLIKTHYDGENPMIQRAFIVSLYCGLRFCDVKDLSYGDIDYSNKLMHFEQNKVKGHSSASGVFVPLNDFVLNIIGKPQQGQNKDTKIFDLPSHTMCLKALRRWTTKAKIDKHITWHCARHSFATNILSGGANVKVVAELLGHSSLKYTEKYLRAIDSQKRDAVNSLPNIKI